VTQGYHEISDIRTGKAPKHQASANKKKRQTISNARVELIEPEFKNHITTDKVFLKWFSSNYSNDLLLKILKELPELEKGKYVGNKLTHHCQENAKSCVSKETDLAVGYVIWQALDTFSVVSHWFNLKDGKVFEYTELDIYDNEEWKENITYLGLKVPNNISSKSYSIIDNWFDKQVGM